MRRPRHAAALAISLPLLAAASGCTAVASPATPVVARTTAASASAQPTAPPDVLAGSINKVRGTGVLSGAMTGTFTITHVGTSYSMLHLRHLRLHGSHSRTVQLGTSVHAIGCNDDGIAYLAGTITTAPDQDVWLQDSSPTFWSDLSYMSAIAITPDEGAADWCDTSHYATATLHWSLPAEIRSLAASDSGAAAHATGQVVTEGGRPIRYTVAAGDTSSAVGRRFGMSAQDLQYLNPLRSYGDDLTLYTGEGLNLDPLNRQWFWR